MADSPKPAYSVAYEVVEVKPTPLKTEHVDLADCPRGYTLVDFGNRQIADPCLAACRAAKRTVYFVHDPPIDKLSQTAARTNIVGYFFPDRFVQIAIIDVVNHGPPLFRSRTVPAQPAIKPFEVEDESEHTDPGTSDSRRGSGSSDSVIATFGEDQYRRFQTMFETARPFTPVQAGNIPERDARLLRTVVRAKVRGNDLAKERRSLKLLKRRIKKPPRPELTKHIADFRAMLSEIFPNFPSYEVDGLIEQAFVDVSTRIGSALVNKAVDVRRAVQLAVGAHARHQHTAYDMLLKDRTPRDIARSMVDGDVADLLDEWANQLPEENRHLVKEVITILDEDEEKKDTSAARSGVATTNTNNNPTAHKSTTTNEPFYRGLPLITLDD